jgi:hypothetical protein
MKNLTVKKLIRIRVHIMVVIGCLFYLASNAQVIPKKIEGKPSYEETVEFIKTNIAPQFFNEGMDGGAPWWLDKKGYKENKYKIKGIKFTDCVMEVQTEVTQRVIGLGLEFAKETHEIELFTTVIDFSKVESISWVSIGQTYCLIGLQFKIKGLNKELKMELPVGRIDCQQPIKWEELKDLKIFKAFNHLRKMCGAPEPVEF